MIVCHVFYCSNNYRKESCKYSHHKFSAHWVAQKLRIFVSNYSHCLLLTLDTFLFSLALFKPACTILSTSIFYFFGAVIFLHISFSLIRWVSVLPYGETSKFTRFVPNRIAHCVSHYFFSLMFLFDLTQTQCLITPVYTTEVLHQITNCPLYINIIIPDGLHPFCLYGSLHHVFLRPNYFVVWLTL